MNDRIPLGELVEHITAEIRSLHKYAKPADAIMKFKECEIEFAVEAERKKDGGFHIWVLKLGGERKRSESNTVKIKYEALEANPQVAKVEAAEGVVAPKGRRGKKVSE